MPHMHIDMVHTLALQYMIVLQYTIASRYTLRICGLQNSGKIIG